jgi:lipid-A-disaccharide synthase
MIIAGEVSGDLHGSALITELKNFDSKLRFFGIGGDKMKSAGMEIVYHLNKMAFLGFAEIIKHLPFIKKVQKNLIELLKEKNISNVILIDYPGFNLNFASKLKKLKLPGGKEIKIIYYISPQLWAWGAGRLKKIRKLVSKMLVLFPFEKEFYREHNIDVEFVGHPLVERIKNYTFSERKDFFRKFDLDESKEILLILPGSREHEIENIFPESIKASTKIAQEFRLQIVIAAPSNIDEQKFYNLTGLKQFRVIKSHTYDLMKYSKIGIIKSGTSTLEAGLFELPMIIVYKTSYLTYLIGKNLIKVKNIGMVNIILEEETVPELIQNQMTPENIYLEIKKILSDEKIYSGIKEKLKKIKKKLGEEGASKKAARSIYSLLSKNELK